MKTCAEDEPARSNAQWNREPLVGNETEDYSGNRDDKKSGNAKEKHSDRCHPLVILALNPFLT